MIINLFFQLEKNEVSLDYRPVIVSSFKSVLSKEYPDFYRSIYNDQPTQKPFTFSVVFPSPKFEPERICLAENSFKVSLSSADEQMTLFFYNAFQKNVQMAFPLANGNRMTLIKTEIKPIPRIVNSSVVIKFLSPLVVRRHLPNGKDQYYIFGEEPFDECLNEVISRQLNASAKIRLEPITLRKTVVRSFGSKIRCSLGIYKLSGDPLILNALLAGGTGSRRSEGFGMFKVIGTAND